jgi:hypothetical protein
VDTDKQGLGQRIQATWQQHPRRVTAVGLTVAVIAGLLIAMLGQIGPRWERYHLDTVGLVIDLPNTPTAEPAGLKGEAGMLYRTSTPNLSLLISGGPIPKNTPVHPRSMIDQAMNFVRETDGITNLQYQITERKIGGKPCLNVSGTFDLQGSPAHLSGAFFIQPDRHAHVICFYSTNKGAKAANRVLSSMRIPADSGAES